MATKKQSKVEEEVITIDLRQLLVPASILLGAIIISIAILIGFNSISSGTASNDDNNALGVQDDTTDDDTTGTGFEDATTTIAGAAKIGSSDAKVAIVEYTDLECPYCKRHHDETMPELIANYVDTGKAVYVIKSFPLSFHNPAATEGSVGAVCARELGGADKYYAFIDKYFATTGTNGQGVDDVAQLGQDIGLNKGDFSSCLEDSSKEDSVAAEISQGSDAGVSGTPGFVIGALSDDGTVVGKRIDGAYPYENFAEVIEQYL
jgi:protein-disulfide isomerase